MIKRFRNSFFLIGIIAAIGAMTVPFISEIQYQEPKYGTTNLTIFNPADAALALAVLAIGCFVCSTLLVIKAQEYIVSED